MRIWIDDRERPVKDVVEIVIDSRDSGPPKIGIMIAQQADGSIKVVSFSPQESVVG